MVSSRAVVSLMQKTRDKEEYASVSYVVILTADLPCRKVGSNSSAHATHRISSNKLTTHVAFPLCVNVCSTSEYSMNLQIGRCTP